MGINVSWHNDQMVAILQDFRPGWTWRDFDQVPPRHLCDGMRDRSPCHHARQPLRRAQPAGWRAPAPFAVFLEHEARQPRPLHRGRAEPLHADDGPDFRPHRDGRRSRFCRDNGRGRANPRAGANGATSFCAVRWVGKAHRKPPGDSEGIMPTYTVDGQTLHVHEDGPARGQSIVMLHGWSSSWFALSPMVSVLRDHYHCYAVDLPGFGDSPPLDGRVDIQKYADLIAGLIQQISPKPVTLMGHSMGGMITVTVALDHPDLVERIVLLCPTISGRLSWLSNYTLGTFAVLEQFPVLGGLVMFFEPILGITDRLLRVNLLADQTEISKVDYSRIRADVRRTGQGRVRGEAFLAMRRHDLRGRLHLMEDTQIPSLVIWGMEDSIVPLRDASVVARRWPAADLRVIPNAGHWPQFETPETARKYVRGFMSTPVKLLKFYDDAEGSNRTDPVNSLLDKL